MSHGATVPTDTYNPQKSNTTGAKAMPGKPTVEIVKREVNAIWTKVVEAEERSRMMRVLVREGIGTNEVERQEGKKAAKRLGGWRDIRNEDNIKTEMWQRLKDNEEYENKMRRERGQKRAELERQIGSKSNEYRKFINILGERMNKLRETLKRKYKEKIRALVGKRKTPPFKIPENLERYTNSRIFTSEEEIPP
jgi:hypothetical protein